MKKAGIFLFFLLHSLFINSQTELWGLMRSGGQFDKGIIFKTDGTANNYQLEYNFTNVDGEQPFYSKLLQAADGKLYGTTSGPTSYLYQYDPILSKYSTKVKMNNWAMGIDAQGSLIQASNGKIYGMTNLGGVSNKGIIYEYDPVSEVFIRKIDFDGTVKGSNPVGTLMQASDGNLYGMTKTGGVNNKGVLFQYDPVSGAFTKKIDFNGTTNGSSPYGDLIQASDGLLYGMTQGGGANNNGVLFQYDPISGLLVNKIDFGGVTTGAFPKGSLMQASDGYLYGMTEGGGTSNKGVIFKYDFTVGVITKVFDFTTGSGANPTGSLMQASDGNLYGLTSFGGLNTYGVLFQFDPVSNTYSTKVNFDGIVKGQKPYGSLMQASDGRLYGTTFDGGSSLRGAFFVYNPTLNLYNKKFSFSASTDGAVPVGGLIKASDGMLYGIAREGGSVYNLGLLFQYNPNTHVYTEKFSFDGVNGDVPYNSLLQSSNGKLYGTVNWGGTDDKGILFEYDVVSGVFTKRHDFNGLDGRSPSVDNLVESSNGKLYGLTSVGGINDNGVLFEFDPITNAYTKKKDFNSGSLTDKVGNCIVSGSNGMLYGLTTTGGVNNIGAIYQYDPLSNNYTIIYDFNTSTGGSPYGLIAAGNGTLYGYTSNGGNYSKGIFFQYDLTTNILTKKYDVMGGVHGVGSVHMLEASNGMFYGISGGGLYNEGLIYEYNPILNTRIKKHDFNISSSIGITGAPFNFLYEVAVNYSVAAIHTSTLNANHCYGSSYNLNVPYNVTGTYNSSNIFTAQLSDSYGSFSSPINIGTLVSTSSDTINAVIPTNTPPGNTYRIRVISSDPPLIGNDNGNNIIVGMPLITASNGTVCQGQTFTINPTGADTYSISGGSFNVAPSSTTGYSITGTDINGCLSSTPTVVYVYVNYYPNVNTVSSSTLLCPGQSATITASGASTYTWNTGVTAPSIVVSPTISTTYTVNATSSSGCSNASTFTQSISVCTELEELNKSNSEIITPNPTNGLITVTGQEVITRVEVVTITGQILMSVSCRDKRHSLQLQNLAEGIYFVNVMYDNGTTVIRKVIKQ